MRSSTSLLFFRRMRLPLIVLISAYSIATVGFTLMPGTDADGNPWKMSLFDAFYVVSYTGSTIGFGEVPYEFSKAQRLWTMVSIYLTVVAWLFSIGSIISLMQDPAFAQALRGARFRRAIRNYDRPFYLLCGYGDTGRLLTQSLTELHHPVVAVDIAQDKIDALSVETHKAPVHGFCMDASMPENLVSAGLQSRWCLGVLAVTADDRVNLKIAVTARLLNQRAAAYARADEGEAADNMRSFDTSHVVRPAEEFVYRLCLLLTRPNSYRLYQWLRSSPEHGLPVQREVAKGRWILCGFGRFGRAVYRAMRELNLPVTVIEENSSLEGLPEDYVVGRGTQAETLQAAGIGDAVGILATTQDDVDNLSILITARSLKSDLFCGAVANRWTNSPLFEAANPEFVAQPGELIAGTILSHIRSPLLSHLFQRLEETSDDEAGRILSLLAPSADSVRQPEFLTVRLSKNRAPALYALLTAGQTLKLELFSRHPVRLGERLEVEVLMLSRGDQDQLLPALDTEMESGDRLLLACSPSAARRVRVLLESEAVAYKTVTGQELQQGWLFRKLAGAGTDLRS
ncbi:MAG: NAD-binding protein [Wenzhouxiangella sp.]|jgi:Trk K+ transport system NAD-binding subunit|nr:NAD-binding protein [Wenzhouxiangella sp.]